MRQKGTIFYNTLLLTGVNLLLRGISILFGIYLSKKIGAEGLGGFQLIGTVGALAMTIGMCGTRVAAMYLCAEEYGKRSDSGVRNALLCCVSFSLLFSTLVAAVFFINAESIAVFWLKNASALKSLRLTALFLPVGCLCSVLAGYFTAIDQVREMVGIEIGEKLLSLLLTVFLLSFCGSETSDVCAAVILGGNLACTAATIALGCKAIRNLRCHSSRSSFSEMPRRMFRLTVPLAFSDYLRAFLSTLEQFLIPWGLARYIGSQQASLSAYGVIHGMTFPILMFPASVLYSLSDLLVPELARRKALGNQVRICALTRHCLHMGLLFSAVMSGLFFVLSDALGMMIYHNEAVCANLRIFAPMIPMLYLDAIVDGMEKGLGQQVATARFNLITSALDVLLLFAFLPRYGLGGYVAAFFLTHLINFWLSLRRLLKVTGYTPNWAVPLKTCFCYLVSAAAGSLYQAQTMWTQIFFRSGIFLTVFFLMLHLTKTLRKNDLLWLYGVLHPGSTVDKTPKIS